NSKFFAGDLAGAQDSSAKAKKWAIWSAIVGVVFSVLAIIFYVAFFAVLIRNGEFESTTY
ncbi:MAG TPA: CD225/dispanin family protein, partial [Aeromicrobium sp.]|nr:CD225/dispanin family protein [Aeromicrobium sp.]